MTISNPSDKREDVKETYEFSVRIKRILGKSKLELLFKVSEVEHNREYNVYEYVIEKLIIYLREKYDVSNSCRYLPIPEYFSTLSSNDGADKCRMIVSRNPRHSQYYPADFHLDHKVSQSIINNSGVVKTLWYKRLRIHGKTPYKLMMMLLRLVWT